MTYSKILKYFRKFFRGSSESDGVLNAIMILNENSSCFKLKKQKSLAGEINLKRFVFCNDKLKLYISQIHRDRDREMPKSYETIEFKSEVLKKMGPFKIIPQPGTVEGTAKNATKPSSTSTSEPPSYQSLYPKLK